MHEDETVSWITDIQETTTSKYEFWQWIIANPLEVQRKLGLVEGTIWCWNELVLRGVPLDIAACGCLLLCHQWRELTPSEIERTLEYTRRNYKETSAKRIKSRWAQVMIFTIIFLTGTIGKHTAFVLHS